MSGSAVPEQLDFLGFVDYAVDRTGRELPEIDLAAMRLVITLHRVTSALVYDLESSVHRPRGFSWPGFRVLFVLWLAGPAEAKRVAELTGMSRAAVSALVNLGYGQPQAAAAVAAASRNAGDGADTASLIRLGLKELAR